ncbi:MAG: molybdenum cofactor biosynthesis protein MoaB [Desulfobacteraceae bacterium]|nr:molybdenum cofactor biosynthesis protein MoaB [Desulfobacteraceae bacterium]
MGHTQHRSKAPKAVQVAVLSISSTRTLKNDQSGHWITGAAKDQGHQVIDHQVVKDDKAAIRAALIHVLADHSPEAVIVTGGTGISPKDVTIEALRPLMSKELTAFGPIFSQLSYAQISSAALMSRATAGIIGNCLVFCLPGSLKACRLACQRLIFPELGHLRHHMMEK